MMPRLRILVALNLATIFLLLFLRPADGFLSSLSGLRVAPASPISKTTVMQVPILDDWKLLNSGEVVGTIRNHPEIDDGDVVKTSPIAKPEGAAARVVVSTESGSKYRLGAPSSAQQKAMEKKSATSSSASSRDTEKDLQKALRNAKQEYFLTGVVVGNGNYLLAGKPKRSTSGKSNIYTCYKNDGNGLPQGDALCVKISPNIEAVRRESQNYQKVTSGINRGKFVAFEQFFGRAGDDRQFNKQCAIVMEKGELDLKAYIEQNGPLTGKQLRDCSAAAVQCVQAMHSSKLVWTDLKAENFVVTDVDKFEIKGIDLESAMPVMGNPVDYSPEACPPEFAEAFLSGDGPYFVLRFSYDVWSLGMMMYEISTGTTMFGGKNPSQITKILKDANFAVDVNDVPDDKLQDLIRRCLQKDPTKRPSIAQILLHPYFLTTGIGPFSW